MIHVKFDRCTKCDAQYEWTTRKPGLCKPCRKHHKLDWQKAYNFRKKDTHRTFERDTMPPVDGLMELQFSTFFSLMRVRYTNIKEVFNVVDHDTYNKGRRKQA